LSGSSRVIDINALRVAVFLLGKHPEAMARLETELDAAGLLVTEQRPAPRAFTYADISKLPWLDACVKARAPSVRCYISHLRSTGLLVTRQRATRRQSQGCASGRISRWATQCF